MEESNKNIKISENKEMQPILKFDKLYDIFYNFLIVYFNRNKVVLFRNTETYMKPSFLLNLHALRGRLIHCLIVIMLTARQQK